MPGCAAVGCSNSTEKGFIMKCFPRDPVRRNVWALRTRRVNWFPTNNSYLCEVHFAPDMWEKVRVDGKRKLKHNAVPAIFTFLCNTEAIFFEEPLNYEGVPDPEPGIDTSVSYNDETIVEAPTGTIPLDSSNDNITVPEVNMELSELRQKLANDNSSKTKCSLIERDKILCASSYNPAESEPDEENNSSSTLTASEFENEASKLGFVEPKTNKMPIKKRNRKYISDLSSSDFSTPQKRRMSLKLVKRVISQQRIKIRSLTAKVKRKKGRIYMPKNEKYRLTEGSLQVEEEGRLPDTPPISGVPIQEQNIQQESNIPLQDAIDEEFIKIEYLDLENLVQFPKIEAEDNLSTGKLTNDQSELGCNSSSQKISYKKSISDEDECSIQQYSSKKQKLNEAQEQPKKRSSQLFLLSLVPHLESMTDHQQLSFQKQVLELLEDIKYPQPQRVSSKYS